MQNISALQLKPFYFELQKLATQEGTMQDTEKYLNSILEKRLGSVPNHAYFSKNANTVTRLPKKQQKLQSMPTVFRVKQETIYKTTGVMPGMAQSKNPLLQNSKSSEVIPLKKQDSGHNQRVEYMAISKRLDSKKEEFTAPTVDVSKYRKTNYIPPDSVVHLKDQPNLNQQRSTNTSGYSQRANTEILIEQQGIAREAMMKPTQVEVSRASQMSQMSTGTRRRNIFGFSKQKIKSAQQF